MKWLTEETHNGLEFDVGFQNNQVVKVMMWVSTDTFNKVKIDVTEHVSFKFQCEMEARLKNSREAEKVDEAYHAWKDDQLFNNDDGPKGAA